MRSIIFTAVIVFLLAIPEVSFTQTLDGNPYKPGVDADINLYIGNWMESMPQKTHGSLVERTILTRGDPLKPPARGAVLKYINRFTHATLGANESTIPTVLKGEQEILYIYSGKGTVTANKKTADLYSGIAVLIPANLEFTLKNTGNDHIA